MSSSPSSPSPDSSCPADVLQRLADHSGVPASQLSTLLVTNTTSSIYMALLDYAGMSCADHSPSNGIIPDTHVNSVRPCDPVSLYVPQEDPVQPDDSLSDEEGGDESEDLFSRISEKWGRGALASVSRGPCVPNLVFGLGEATVIWPPPPHLDGEYLYQARRAKSLGLPPPPVSGNVKDGHSLENDNNRNSADTGSLSSTDLMSVHISHFRIGGPVRTSLGDATQVYGIVTAVALPHRHEALRTLTTDLTKWKHKKGRRLDGGDRYTIMRFRTSDRFNRWEYEGTRRTRPCNSVVLRKGVMEALIADTSAFLSTRAVAWYRTHGLPHRRSFLFHGPPGTGKTSTARVLASEFQLACCVLNVTDRRFSNQALNDAVAKLNPHSLLLIEDVDALFHKRDAAVEGGVVHEMTFSGLLNALDGVLSADHVVTVLTTNHKDKLDEALVRAGRIDRQFLFDLPGENEIRTLFERFYPDCSDEEVKDRFVQAVMARHETGAKSVATLQELFIMYREESAKTCAGNVDTFFKMFFDKGGGRAKTTEGMYV